MTAGYSGTPLAKKLGVTDAQRTWRHAMPPAVAKEIARDGSEPALLKTLSSGTEMAHIFVTRRAELARLIAKLRNRLAPTARSGSRGRRKPRRSTPISPRRRFAKWRFRSASST